VGVEYDYAPDWHPLAPGCPHEPAWSEAKTPPDPQRSNPNRTAYHSRSATGLALHGETATLDEDLCQPFRFADHQHVAGVYLDERLHFAKRGNALVLNLHRDGAITPSEYPRAWHIVGHTAAVNFFYHDGG